MDKHLADLLGVPRQGGKVDGFHIVGPSEFIETWNAWREAPEGPPPASPRKTFPDPVTCGCGAVFTPLRRGTRWCSDRCRRTARSRRRRAENGEAETRRARDRRRERRRTDPAFREMEARHSREYRRRKRGGD